MKGITFHLVAQTEIHYTHISSPHLSFSVSRSTPNEYPKHIAELIIFQPNPPPVPSFSHPRRNHNCPIHMGHEQILPELALSCPFSYPCLESHLQQFHPSHAVASSAVIATGSLWSVSHSLSSSPRGCKFPEAEPMMPISLDQLCFLHRPWQRETPLRC